MFLEEMNWQPRHSLLLVLDSDGINEAKQSKLEVLLLSGVKVYLFVDQGLSLGGLKGYQKLKLLHIYDRSKKDKVFPAAFCVIDGQCETLEDRHILEELALAYPEFNLEQFDVEHAPADRHLSVEAGAGTGKTTVMVQRVLFLLHTTSVPLQNIAMITFTRKAAQNMFQRLRKEFYARFQATSNPKYLSYMEELSAMRISTIHSFAKSLVQQLGSVLGYGQDVQIRQFGSERRKTIETFLNHHLETWMKTHAVSNKLQNFRLYEFVDYVVSYWTEIEKKGFTEEDIRQMNWGVAVGRNAELQDIFKELFLECERIFQELKERANAVSLNDLTRQIDVIVRKSGISSDNLAQPISYLFIDEFQDTDDTQIRLACSLQQAFQAQLFVVGDIKQSIYRFRGANHTAFQQLNQLMTDHGEQLSSYPLKKNYRSSSNLLRGMDTIFSEWGTKQYLTYGENDRLIGMKDENFSLGIERVNVMRREMLQSKVIQQILKAQKIVWQEADQSPEIAEKPSIAVLVRTNQEARDVKHWCDESNIFAQLDIGGLFFLSDAVHDFDALIEALLFPADSLCQLNMRSTPYVRTAVSWTALAGLNGDPKRVLELLDQYPPHEEWSQFQTKLRVSPVLSVLREIIEKTDVCSSYYRRQLEQLQRDPSQGEHEYKAAADEAKTRAKQYHKNLNHIFELLHQKFSDDFLTLHSIHKWLKVNKSFNRDEDEPELSDEYKKNRVQILSVHKAKGLEFHTVIVPFTERAFRYERSEILFEKGDEELKVGWFIKENGQFSNEHFVQLVQEEEREVLKEETRLLYVAMTRAEKHLWILNNIRFREQDRKNWSFLLPRDEVILNA